MCLFIVKIDELGLKSSITDEKVLVSMRYDCNISHQKVFY